MTRADAPVDEPRAPPPAAPSDVRAPPAPGLFSLNLLPALFPAVNGARVLGLLSVMQAHVTNLMLWSGLLPPGEFARRSLGVWFGMDLFFLLSGFLIGSMLLHADEKLDARRVLRFYLRRMFRIFPLYYVVLAFVALEHPPLVLPKLALEYLYLTNYSPYRPVIMGWAWSLCVEEHFYLAVPVLVLLLRFVRSTRARLALLGLLWASGTLVRIHALHARPGGFSAFELFTTIYVQTHTRYDVLIAGVALAYVYRTYRPWLDAFFSRPGVRLGAGALVLSGFAVLMMPSPLGDEQLWSMFCWGTITSVIYFVVVLLLICGDGWVKRLLSSPWLLAPATLSYGVYLIHIPVCDRLVMPVARALSAGGLSPLPVWGLSLAMLSCLSLAISFALHLAIEKPLLALRDRLVPLPAAGATMPAPVTEESTDKPAGGEAAAPGPRKKRGLFSLVLLPERFPALHGARVIAILSVMQVHLTNILFADRIIPGGAFVAGSMSVWFGMDLFFMLSGFLIGSMLLHSEQPLGARGILRFYTRRAFRIFPLYYLVLTFLAFRRPPVIFAKLLAGYLYVSNYSIYQPPIMSWAWSLCVEEHFYLLVPVLVALLRLIASVRARLALLAALWASGTLVRLYVLYSRPTPWTDYELFTQVYERTHTRYDVLIAGVTLAFVYRAYRARLEQVFARPRVRLLAGAFVLALFAVLYVRPGRDPNLAWILSWGTGTSLVYFVLFLLLIFGGGRVKRLLSARWFLYPATLGYGVYLIHIPVCESLVAPISLGLALSGSPPLLTWSVSFALMALFCISIAYVLHIVVEKPILAIRDRFLP